MAIAGTDAFGSFLDTGTNTITVVRASVEQETHTSFEIDSGAKYSSGSLVTSHIPHRSANSPR